jgi:hypothetical protein
MPESGTGVDREQFEEAIPDEKERDVEFQMDVEAPPEWTKEYHDTPQTLDQAVRHPESVKYGPLQNKVFKLDDDAKVGELNRMLAMTEPEEAPQVVVKDYCREFNKVVGNFVVLLTYQRVYYKHKDIGNG